MGKVPCVVWFEDVGPWLTYGGVRKGNMINVELTPLIRTYFECEWEYTSTKSDASFKRGFGHHEKRGSEIST